MPKPVAPYNDVFRRFHSLLMMVLLLWLTVSMPFVYTVQQDAAVEQLNTDGNDVDPFPGAAEEKVETGGGGLSEYLHETHHGLVSLPVALLLYKPHPDDYYSAFHPELVSPPPEA